MTREEAIGHIKDVICENNTIKPSIAVFEQEKEALYMAIKALKHKPCEDAISRDQAKCDYADWYGYGYEDNTFYKHLCSMSSVVGQPKIGRWIFVDKAKEHAHCSECDYGNVDLFDGRPHNYCPDCGTKMEVEE